MFEELVKHSANHQRMIFISLTLVTCASLGVLNVWISQDRLASVPVVTSNIRRKILNQVVEGTTPMVDIETEAGPTKTDSTIYLRIIQHLLSHPNGSLSSDKVQSLQDWLDTSVDEKIYVRKILEGEKVELKADSRKPSLAYETVRRQIDNGVRELWYYIRGRLRKLSKMTEDENIRTVINVTIVDGAAQHRTILKDVYNLTQVDGYQMWREKESAELTRLMQNRLRYLQNPPNCDEAKKLICDLRQKCGFGCLSNHVAYCQMVAYGMGRTLVLDTERMDYGEAAYKKFIMPLSDTCQFKKSMRDEMVGYHPAKDLTKSKHVFLSYVDHLAKENRIPLKYLGTPEDIAHRLMTLHGHPIMWWVGQLFRYTQRPTRILQDEIDKLKSTIDFQHPIVGTHIRRGDKVAWHEMAFHDAGEYVYYINEYFAELALREQVPVKRVYLSSDDPTVLPNVRKRFPEITFIRNNALSKTAGPKTRYSAESLKDVLLDTFFMGSTDFFVGTMTSGTGRSAVARMQSYKIDGAMDYRSLDKPYFFQGQYNIPDRQQPYMRAIYNHTPRSPDELEVQTGDILNVNQNFLNGYTTGKNHRLKSKKHGLCPSYKLVDIVRYIKTPSYEEADKLLDL